MKTWFEWRELTEDGLLKSPKECGPYYDRDQLKNDYATEEEAIDDYREFLNRNPFCAPYGMALLKFYSPAGESK
jgi:hypothetical protein